MGILYKSIYLERLTEMGARWLSRAPERARRYLVVKSPAAVQSDNQTEPDVLGRLRRIVIAVDDYSDHSNPIGWAEAEPGRQPVPSANRTKRWWSASGSFVSSSKT